MGNPGLNVFFEIDIQSSDGSENFNGSIFEDRGNTIEKDKY